MTINNLFKAINLKERHAQHTARGQMWPAEAFNLALEAKFLFEFACFVDKNTL